MLGKAWRLPGDGFPPDIKMLHARLLHSLRGVLMPHMPGGSEEAALSSLLARVAGRGGSASVALADGDDTGPTVCQETPVMPALRHGRERSVTPEAPPGLGRAAAPGDADDDVPMQQERCGECASPRDVVRPGRQSVAAQGAGGDLLEQVAAATVGGLMTLGRGLQCSGWQAVYSGCGRAGGGVTGYIVLVVIFPFGM